MCCVYAKFIFLTDSNGHYRHRQRFDSITHTLFGGAVCVGPMSAASRRRFLDGRLVPLLTWTPCSVAARNIVLVCLQRMRDFKRYAATNSCWIFMDFPKPKCPNDYINLLVPPKIKPNMIICWNNRWYITSLILNCMCIYIYIWCPIMIARVQRPKKYSTTVG